MLMKYRLHLRIAVKKLHDLLFLGGRCSLLGFRLIQLLAARILVFRDDLGGDLIQDRILLRGLSVNAVRMKQHEPQKQGDSTARAAQAKDTNA